MSRVLTFLRSFRKYQQWLILDVHMRWNISFLLNFPSAIVGCTLDLVSSSTTDFTIWISVNSAKSSISYGTLHLTVYVTVSANRANMPIDYISMLSCKIKLSLHSASIFTFLIFINPNHYNAHMIMHTWWVAKDGKCRFFRVFFIFGEYEKNANSLKFWWL